MDATRRQRLLEACRVIFGVEPDPSFLWRMQPTRLRTAWRRCALATHPDRVRDPAARPAAAERFIRASRAYEMLRTHLADRGRRACRTAPAHRPPARPPHGGRAAPLPHRPLRLGEFLVRSRVVGFADLVAAILWQRGRRERFCEVLRRWRLLDEDGASDLLRRRRPCERVGEAARRLGLLTDFQVRTVIRHQRLHQPPIGAYFVARGLLSRRELDRHLRECERHRACCAGR